MEYISLRNGDKIPCIGLGTWNITDRELMAEVIASAYDEGYRLIDTAAAYSNEISIAKAISAAGINREELILSDKVWNTSRGYDAVQDACRKSLKKLKTDYLDIYLIHWPASMKLYPNWEEINADTWRGMERLYKDGFVRNIGVCNFKVHHLEALKKTAEIIPCINQIEMHPGFLQQDIMDYCHKEGVVVEASSPLGNGQILENETLNTLAKAAGVSVAGLCLRWLYQKRIISIPKTTNRERLKENVDIFDFELSEEMMEKIDKISYCGGIGIDPDEVEEFG